jgi:hypothetical protein
MNLISKRVFTSAGPDAGRLGEISRYIQQGERKDYATKAGFNFNTIDISPPHGCNDRQ